jgi:glycopeptide antibiotics resistance protein
MYEVIASVLTILIAQVLKWVFAKIKYEIDEAQFNTLVAAIVVWFMTLFFAETAVRGIQSLIS